MSVDFIQDRSLYAYIFSSLQLYYKSLYKSRYFLFSRAEKKEMKERERKREITFINVALDNSNPREVHSNIYTFY